MLKSKVPHLILAAVLLMVTMIIQAESTSSITGVVIDYETNQPIVGASVVLIGTTKGAMTDADGKFTIEQVPPGTYELKITHLEFGAVKIINVVVVAKTPKEISATMVKKVSDLDVAIVVKDQRDVLDIHSTTGGVSISRETTEAKPVATIDKYLTPVAEIVSGKDGEVRIRGPRAVEVDYVVDGGPVNDQQGGLGMPSAIDKKRAACIGIVRGMTPPAHGGTAIVNGEVFDAMFFKNYGVNPFVDTEDDHFSTFAIDVDDASYVMARSYLGRGAIPPDDAVRTEEFVNHFNHNYQAPHDEPFRIYVEGSPSRFGQNCQMLKIGIKGSEIAPENRKSANLVFVVDISGSMDREDRLSLVKQALRLLVDELRPDDRVGIVVYGSNGRVHLQPTWASNNFEIVRAIEQLQSGGSTNAEEGLKLGYKMADECFEKGKINRVILCSDGVANVGTTKAEDLLKWIKGYADRGITLSSIGFGMGNYNDIMLEKLGNRGNGYYAYVGNLPEAKRIFVDNLTGNLQVIARDVKIQVDFDPKVVRSYRLLGYENRDVADEDFRNDAVDGGEIGSGHEVTALYEIKFHEGAERSDIGKVFVRFKDPDNGEVTEVNRSIGRNVFNSEFASSSREFRMAACAAEFAEMLRKSYWAKEGTWDDLLGEVRLLVGQSDSNELVELLGLISKSKQFNEQLAER